MGYRVFSFGARSQSPEVKEFEEAAMMAKEGVENMCALAEEMFEKYSDEFSERGGYSNRGGSYGQRGYSNRGGYSNREGGYSNREGGYSNRDGGMYERDWDGGNMEERRMRDFRGRYR